MRVANVVMARAGMLLALTEYLVRPSMIRLFSQMTQFWALSTPDHPSRW